MDSNLLAFGFPQGPEMIFIFILILLLFGAKKLPQLARGFGKSAGEFKKARAEFENEIKTASDDAERTTQENENNSRNHKESSPQEISDASKDEAESKRA